MDTSCNGSTSKITQTAIQYVSSTCPSTYCTAKTVTFPFRRAIHIFHDTPNKECFIWGPISGWFGLAEADFPKRTTSTYQVTSVFCSSAQILKTEFGIAHRPSQQLANNDRRAWLPGPTHRASIHTEQHTASPRARCVVSETRPVVLLLYRLWGMSQ